MELKSLTAEEIVAETKFTPAAGIADNATVKEVLNDLRSDLVFHINSNPNADDLTHQIRAYADALIALDVPEVVAKEQLQKDYAAITAKLETVKLVTNQAQPATADETLRKYGFNLVPGLSNSETIVPVLDEQRANLLIHTQSIREKHDGQNTTKQRAEYIGALTEIGIDVTLAAKQFASDMAAIAAYNATKASHATGSDHPGTDGGYRDKKTAVERIEHRRLQTTSGREVA